MSQLVSLQELKEFLSIKQENTNDDARLSNISLQVGSLVTSYCGREFSLSEHEEYYDGGTSSIFVSNPPINRVTEVSQFTGTEYTTLGGPDINGQPIVVEGYTHSISLIGAPVLKTRTKKFGKSSLAVSTGNYLQIGSSDDWEFGADDFTIELFARFGVLSASTLLSSGTLTDGWYLSFDPITKGVYFSAYSASIKVLELKESTISTYEVNKFYHIVLERVGNVFTIYKDGVILATINSTISIPKFSTGILIGSAMNGYIDNLRISHKAVYAAAFDPVKYQLTAITDVKLLLTMDGTNNSSVIIDSSRQVNEFSFYRDTGEILFGMGYNSSLPGLSLTKNDAFDAYPNGVRVSYIGGYESIPADLKMAIMEMVKVTFKGKSNTDVVWSGKDKLESMPLSIDGFPPAVRRVLSLYRLIN